MRILTFAIAVLAAVEISAAVMCESCGINTWQCWEGVTADDYAWTKTSGSGLLQVNLQNHSMASLECYSTGTVSLSVDLIVNGQVSETHYKNVSCTRMV